VSDLSAAQKRELKIESGVLVDFADGRAATAGIEPGDLILQINNAEVSSAAQFNGLVPSSTRRSRWPCWCGARTSRAMSSSSRANK
jgi:S1-C subfamily serine protease